ncbi:hypothetical protein predicted by Glimmer/Critica [Acetobacter senegalensis]|uniref:Uncharacterized protein n=1 Tax=Acetobacter senegalensis TaxID=446692 RepID=A0A0U5ET73_9PROT|nr:hypothetical protein predicted by Glimmer/Critica [Acetobacter senegalensis]
MGQFGWPVASLPGNIAPESKRASLHTDKLDY